MLFIGCKNENPSAPLIKLTSSSQFLHPTFFFNFQKSNLPSSWCSYVVAWVIRELLYVLIYFEAIINVRHVSWGKRSYRLSNFGESVQIVSDKGVLPIWQENAILRTSHSHLIGVVARVMKMGVLYNYVMQKHS